MNTAFTIITATIVVGVLAMLIIMAVSDYISDKRREREYNERKRRENYYNSILPKAITFKNVRGFIKAEYAFGRFYVHYECIDECFDHYSKTISFNHDGSIKENYSRIGTKYGFASYNHNEAFHKMKAEVREIISKL